MNLRLCCIAAILSTVLIGAPAAATAMLSGAVEAIASSGNCSDTKQVPANTAQAVRDTLSLSAAAACNGQAATADLHAEAATGTIGIRGFASGSSTGSSQAFGQVSLVDHWFFTVPVGTAAGSISIPVSIKLEGSISPGAIMDGAFGRFLDYSLAITDTYSNAGLTPFGHIATTGTFSEIFNGNLNLTYFGPNSPSPVQATVEMQLFLVSLLGGTLDFFNTASISLNLPQGFSATTSSGLPLIFGATTPEPVPEPGILSQMLAGLILIGFFARLRKTRQAG